MESSFGARLRLQRERQQVALSAIAEKTKIKLSLLEALERDDVSQWPGGIFRRSYVRAYAQAIGLSPDTVLREFLQRFPEPLEDVEASLAARADARSRPHTRLGFLIGSAFGALPLRRPQPNDSATGSTGADSGQDGAVGETPVPVRASANDGRVAAEPSCNPAPLDASDSPGVSDEPLMEAANDAVECAARQSSRPTPDIAAVASLCTRLGQAADTGDVIQVFEDAAVLLDAVGAVLWTCDPRAGVLTAVLAHGYSEEVLSRLPRIRHDADNAIAAAFRAAETRVVDSSDQATGALVVPLLGTAGCTGVLAVELREGGEQDDSVRAVLAILAAQLSLLIGEPPVARAASA